MPSGGGIRFRGIDLRQQLTEEQVAFLLDSLAHFRIISIADQDIDAASGGFSLANFERLANHFGAPVAHPNNYTRGGKPVRSASSEPETLLLYGANVRRIWL